ncbi:MAG TPA: endonuclease/exonuclease/phosphatase family protein [Solirubrobacteraceae bacterium]|nr:endonuclease/exonuclease/phosphatase family protein [Solirubrobacteraceae bacterium]
MLLRVLTWNLLHGRSVPPAGRDLFDEFCAALAGWEWDVALLQEVPPWWPAALGERLGADERLVLTSRNALLDARRAIAVRRPDLIKSNGGGANAILVRGDVVVQHRWRRLCLWPERRWVHAIRPGHAGAWFANLHAGGPMRDVVRAAASVTRWAGDAPIVFGGDFNIRDLRLDGFEHAGGFSVDHVFVRGLQPVACDVLERGRLSDHAPVLVELTLPDRPEVQIRAA